MRPASIRWGSTSLLFLAISFASVLFVHPNIPSVYQWLKDIDLQSFKTMYVSIMLEAFPFILLGVFVSSLLQVLVSERVIQKLVPKNIFVGLIAAALIGILFPVCECGMIPVVRRLIQEGMPAPMGITYLLAAPVLNPVVYFATYTAFRGIPGVLFPRMGLAFFVAVTAGFFVYSWVHRNPLNIRADQFQISPEDQTPFSWKGWTEHMLGEFFSMGKYLLFGTFVAACLQTFVARSTFVEIGQHSWVSYPFMMGLSYVLSLCSTSDAFVAASFNGTFSKGSLIAFMVFGPMLDFKSTLMLFAAFRARFVIFLMLLITVLVWVGSMIISQI